MKKKLVVFYPGKWAESLLTIERYKEISFFVTDDSDIDNMSYECYFDKRTFPASVLKTEDKDAVIILISDNYRYNHAKDVLEAMGFIENIHFFNAWKLDFRFYKEFYSDGSWQSHEKEDKTLISDSSYNKRSKIMASLIPKDVKSLMDVGCGDAFLKQYIPSDLKYFGLDVCPRKEASFVCDLNKESLPKIEVDMYYMAGLLYYINDLDNLFSQMTNAKYILYDYGGTERYLRLDGVPNDPLINARNNFYSQEYIFNTLHKYSFSMEHAYWDPNNGKIGWHIYLFKNSKL